jgi:hypothetical protein
MRRLGAHSPLHRSPSWWSAGSGVSAGTGRELLGSQASLPEDCRPDGIEHAGRVGHLPPSNKPPDSTRFIIPQLLSHAALLARRRSTLHRTIPGPVRTAANGGRQLRCRRNHLGETAGEVVAVLREQHDIFAFPWLQAIAIELDFMYPAGTGWQFLGQRRQARLDERVLTQQAYFLFPPLITRSGVMGKSGGRIGGFRSGK